MEEPGVAGALVLLVLMEAPAREHCHVRIPANQLEEKVAEEEEVEELVVEEEDDGLSPQQQGEVLVVE